MHLIVIVIVIVYVQNEYIDCSYQSKTKIPSIMNKEASQWLNIPYRWSQQYSINQPSNEINQSLKKLERINENGIQQFDSQSIDSVSLEVLYELSTPGRRFN
jgi:hypothetical protein